MNALRVESHSRDVLSTLYSLYQDQSLCDTILISQDNALYHTHRIVLSATSQFLHQVLLESQEVSTIKLDMPSSVLDVLLMFTYTGEVHIPSNLWREVQQASIFLQMESLHDLLSKFPAPIDHMKTDVLPCYDTSVPVDSVELARNSGPCFSIQESDVEATVDSRNAKPDAGIQCSDTKLLKENAIGFLNDLGLTEKFTKIISEEPVQEINPVSSLSSSTTTYRKSARLKEKFISKVSGGIAESTDDCTSKALSRTKSKQHKLSRSNVRKGKDWTLLSSKVVEDHDIHSSSVEKSDQRIRKSKLKSVSSEIDNEIGLSSDKSTFNENIDIVQRIQTSSNYVNSQVLMPKRSCLTCRVCERTFRSYIQYNNHRPVHEIDLPVNSLRYKFVLHQALCQSSATRMKQLCKYKYIKQQALNRSPTTSKQKYILHEGINKSYSTWRKGLHKHMVRIRKAINQGYTCTTGTNGTYKQSVLQQAMSQDYTPGTEGTLKQRPDKCKQRQLILGWFRYYCYKRRQQKIVSAVARQQKIIRQTHISKTQSAPESKSAEKRREPADTVKIVSPCSGKAQSENRVRRASSRKSGTGYRERREGKRKSGTGLSEKTEGNRKKLFECPVCRLPLISQATLRRHLQKIHDHSKDEADRLQYQLPDCLPCDEPLCTFQTDNLLELGQHMETDHQNVQYPCSQCSHMFCIKLLLERHIQLSHESSQEKHRCDTCGQTFSKRYTLERHEYWKHGIENPRVKVFKCEFEGCEYRTSAASSVRAHQSKHYTEKPFTCQYCSMKLKTEVCYRKHVNKMHLGIRPYLCQVCGQNFGEEHELRSHITNRHSETREYQCSFCPYNTAVKATFHTHMYNVHKVQADEDKRKVYSCPQCPFTTVLSHSYRTHVNGHTNTRSYTCPVCNQAFISSASLRAHKKWKHSDKQITCTQCGYQTKTSQKLNEHIRVQHQLKGMKPYKCPYCDFRCDTGGNTRKHVKKQHKGETVTYIRDDELLQLALAARASGNYSSLSNSMQKQMSAETDASDSNEM